MWPDHLALLPARGYDAAVLFNAFGVTTDQRAANPRTDPRPGLSALPGVAFRRS